MGYAAPDQKAKGIHLRQFSRAFIFQDGGGERLAFVSVDCGMIGSGLRKEVSQKVGGEASCTPHCEKKNIVNVLLMGISMYSNPCCSPPDVQIRC